MLLIFFINIIDSAVLIRLSHGFGTHCPNRTDGINLNVGSRNGLYLKSVSWTTWLSVILDIRIQSEPMTLSYTGDAGAKRGRTSMLMDLNLGEYIAELLQLSRCYHFSKCLWEWSQRNSLGDQTSDRKDLPGVTGTFLAVIQLSRLPMIKSMHSLFDWDRTSQIFYHLQSVESYLYNLLLIQTFYNSLSLESTMQMTGP